MLQRQCVQDKEYAAQPGPMLPPEELLYMRPHTSLTLTMLAIGQARTGKTSTVRSLLASFAGTATFQPTDVSGLTGEDFVTNPDQFVTEVICKDCSGGVSVTYRVLVRTLPRL